MSSKPAKFTWSGVTPQLFLVVVLPLTILLVVTTFGGLRLHQLSMRTLVGERDERAARAAASALTEQVTHRISILHSLALQISPASGMYDPVQISSEMDYFSADFDRGLAVYNSQGQLMDFSGDRAFWQEQDFISLSTPPSQTASDGTLEIYTIKGLAENPPIIFLVTPRQPNGFTIVGAFSPTFPIEQVLADVFSPSSGGYAFVIDADRQVLYQVGTQPEPGEPLVDHVGVSEALGGSSGSAFIEAGGEEHVVAYSPILPVGWALVIEEPWDVVTSPLLRLTEYAPLVLIPILLLALLAIWFGTSRIVQPLRQLEKRASALGWGDYDSIQVPVGGIAEIRYLQKELVQLAEKVNLAQQSLRGYIRVMTRGLEEERHKLARELHDDTLQSLIALNQRIQLARLAQTDHTQLQSLDEIQDITEKTILDLRRTARALRPIYLEDLGLAAALEMLANETREGTGLEVQFQCSGVERRLSDEVELAIYRMVQEAMSNIARHADASRVGVSIAFSKAHLLIQVEDDGKGFGIPESPSAFASGGHYGLLGMFERSELIGAKLELHSKPGQGTRITILLPLSEQD